MSEHRAGACGSRLLDAADTLPCLRLAVSASARRKAAYLHALSHGSYAARSSFIRAVTAVTDPCGAIASAHSAITFRSLSVPLILCFLIPNRTKQRDQNHCSSVACQTAPFTMSVQRERRRKTERKIA